MIITRMLLVLKLFARKWSTQLLSCSVGFSLTIYSVKQRKARARTTNMTAWVNHWAN
jgi:hypothetical protein